jgi:hypothetical protein
MSNDLYCKHPKVPGLFVHGNAEHNTSVVEGELQAETVVVQDEFFSHSPWLTGFEVDADTVLELKHNHNVVRVVKDTDAVITLPSFKHSTPVAFQLVVAQGCKNMTLKLPEGGAWSSASWSAYGQLEKDGLVLGAVACDEGVVISVRSRALCEDGKFIYVLQCRRV